MERVYNESEHQELFYRDTDVYAPIPIHIPSALGKLGYYVCVLIPEAHASAFDAVVTKMKVGGMHPDDVTLRNGEGFSGTALYRSKRNGRVWRVLCRANVSRGDGTLSFGNLPSGLPRSTVLLCTWPRFIASGEADDWLACQSDPKWAPGGVPLGGIGTGKVEICRDGRFRNFSGNNNQDMPFEEPDGLCDAFFSVREGSDETALTTHAIGGIKPCDKLNAELTFPRAKLTAIDALAELDVSVRLAGPLIPHDLQTSSLPGFIVRASLHNKAPRARTVAFRFAWPNLVGHGGGIGEAESRVGYGDGYYRRWEAPANPSAEVIHGNSFKALRYSNAPSTIAPGADGHHYIALRCDRSESESIDPNALSGSVTKSVKLGAGETAVVDFALCWEMPRYIDLLGVERGHYWQQSCRDGKDVLELLFERFERILNGGGALEALLTASDLPGWLKSRLLNCCYPLVTNSVLYRDGRFSINEGPTEMAACFGTIDQRLGAHPATQLLFPELNSRELEQFAAIQGPQGGIQHDLGGGTLERGPGETAWPDLTCSFVLQSARHAWTTGERNFEERMWPRVRKAILRHGEWADAGGGVAQVGTGLGTSYDGYHYIGTTPYMATLWLATLHVGRVWATRRSDAELLTKIERWMKMAQTRLDSDLWNGQFYCAYGSVDGPKNPNSHAGMLAGEYFARMLCGEDVIPTDKLQSCLNALATLNLNERFTVPPDEAAPDGNAGSEFGWLPYVEAFALTAMAVNGDMRMLPAFERIVRAMERDGAGVGDTRLMYRPLTGEPSWGAYYMTAPASWLVYDALLDFSFTPEDGTLRLIPKLKGKLPVIHPLFWGVLNRTGEKSELTIEQIFGTRAQAISILETPRFVDRVSINNAPATPLGERGVYRRFALKPVELQAGSVLTWTSV